MVPIHSAMAAVSVLVILRTKLAREQATILASGEMQICGRLVHDRLAIRLAQHHGRIPLASSWMVNTVTASGWKASTRMDHS